MKQVVAQNDNVSQVSFWKKLFTKEDSRHLHKTLGMLCLASFAWRIVYGITINNSDMAFVSYPKLTVPTILLHLLLNLSSFEFRIPERRINTGYRIWPEYRLHSLVFLCHSLAFPLLQYCENLNGLPPNYLWNVAIVLACLTAADIASASTIFMVQLCSCLSIWWHQYRRTSLWCTFDTCLRHSNECIPHDTQAKNLLSHEAGIAVYACMLGVGFLTAVWVSIRDTSEGPETPQAINLVGNVAAMLRLGLGMNKYVLWTAIGVAVNVVIRPAMQGQSNGLVSKELLNMANPISTVVLLFLGFYKAGMLPRLSMVVQANPSKKAA
ncbi:expressed unknown protein [Seminavis robusta]|uniref:Uncharacterized protein n=1 Tax=Seminavis robusta TaxID=568900 RepID=A0A9N8HQF6_9STRA|nr:expressed unknown protein [Seminavis robusta]|eukprot:Sro980_g227400.1 n/a (324) ;mRNA; r:22499-23626